MTNKPTTLTNKPTTQTQTAPSDNKVVFGPLGKYAIVAVLMVSIIVTTAIMLDKQLNSAENNQAAISTEFNTIPSVSTAQSGTETQAIAATIQTKSEQNTALTTMDNQQQTSTKPATQTPAITTAKVASTTSTTTTEVTVAKSVPTAKPEKKVAAITTDIKTKNASPATVSTANITASTTAVTDITKPVAVKSVNTVHVKRINRQPVRNSVFINHFINHTSFNNRLAEQNINRQMNAQYKQVMAANRARAKTIQRKQKKNMSDMFARIHSLENQQLQVLQAQQQQQVEILRKQLEQQQQMINRLKNRNTEILNLRRADFQRAQQQRQTILKRI